MDIATYVLEFVVYVVPLTVSLFVVYTFYSRKDKFLNLFYDVLFPYEKALEELQKFKGTQFDTDVVDAFASISLEEIKKAHEKLDTISIFKELINIYYK
jgi:hypothetical protein